MGLKVARLDVSVHVTFTLQQALLGAPGSGQWEGPGESTAFAPGRDSCVVGNEDSRVPSCPSTTPRPSPPQPREGGCSSRPRVRAQLVPLSPVSGVRVLLIESRGPAPLSQAWSGAAPAVCVPGPDCAVAPSRSERASLLHSGALSRPPARRPKWHPRLHQGQN